MIRNRCADMWSTSHLTLDTLSTSKGSSRHIWRLSASTGLLLLMTLPSSACLWSMSGKSKYGFPLIIEVCNSLTNYQDNGKFFSTGTKTSVLPYYQDAFPLLVHAVSLHLKSAITERDFFLILGLCTRSLCDRADEDAVPSCLKALESIVRP